MRRSRLLSGPRRPGRTLPPRAGCISIPVTDDRISYTMIPMYRHAQWMRWQLRIGLGNPEPGHMTLQAFFLQYDTRHNINCQNFVRRRRYFW